VVVRHFVYLGIMSLIISKLGGGGDFWGKIEDLGLFVVTVVTGLSVHCFIVYPLIFTIFVRKNVLKYYRGMFQAILTALGTSSSSATLPVTIECVERNGVNRKIARFMLPLGATIVFFIYSSSIDSFP